jgi:hypothetical protein
MPRIIKIIAIIFAIVSSAFAHQITFEAATGVGSLHMPFSSKWEGRVTDGGLFFKEYAIRGSYKIDENLSIASAIGWISERHEIIGDVIFATYAPYPPLPEWDLPSPPNREITYLIPSIRYEHRIIRAELGAVLYDSHPWDIRYEDHYPFNGNHKLKFSGGLEFGENRIYILFRLLDSFPLYSGGGLIEAGLGGRKTGVYEHKVYLAGQPFDAVALGYRGEIRIYKNTAISLGLGIGGNDRDNIYTFSLGIKTLIGK